ncbi:MAG: hypothetical protein IPI87_15810 [Betaproteobacteria bacterium]|nr:hypothetical protein [Betaproteobacteria bacterium]
MGDVDAGLSGDTGQPPPLNLVTPPEVIPRRRPSTPERAGGGAEVTLACGSRKVPRDS